MTLDDRWIHGMNGWRVFAQLSDRFAYGEVTGYTHDGDYIFVVVDGEEDPRRLRWQDVRPA